MQSIPLAVLKRQCFHQCHQDRRIQAHCMQSIPLAVLKLFCCRTWRLRVSYCMQSIPLAVLKRIISFHFQLSVILHAIHTACGIETQTRHAPWTRTPRLHAIHTACGIETTIKWPIECASSDCMQSIPLAVLKHQLHHCHIRFRGIACNPYRLRYFFYFLVRFFQTAAFFYGIMELSKKIFPGRDSDVCHLYDVGGNESD